MKSYINKILNIFASSARENKQMLAYSMDIRFFLDKRGTFKKIHRTCESIWGYSEAELKGKIFLDYVHPDDKELTKNMWGQIEVDHEVKGFQNRFVHQDGNIMYMSWSVMSSSALNSYFFVGHDETKAVLTEKALRQSQHYAELVIATAHDAFVCIDEESIVIDWNPQAHTIFGWSKQEALGRQLDELIIPERLRERHKAGLKHFMSVKSGPMISKRIELPALHKSGHELLIEITISPIQIDGHYRFSAFMRDVTVAKQVQLELKDAKSLAKAATRAKSEFLANMSHEIRTPMNGVVSSTALLLKTPLELEQQQYLALIKTSADSLLHILDEILDLSKLEANKLELDLKTFGLREAFESTFKTFTSNAYDKKLELICHITPNVPAYVVGDFTRISQIIVNLIHNAIKFTQQGHVLLEVTEKSRVLNKSTLMISVADTGIGISQDQQLHICEAFVQADQSTTRLYGGAGLGLAIVSNLIAIMNGRFWIESELGNGATFNIELTLEIPESHVTQDQDVSLNSISQFPVLIISVNELLLQSLSDAIIALGFNSKYSSNTDQAYEVMRHQYSIDDPIKLILIDLTHSKDEVFDFLVKYHAEPAFAQATIALLVSTHEELVELKRFNDLYISQLLLKPVKHSELSKLLSIIANENSLQGISEGQSIKHLLPYPKPKLRVLIADDHAVNQEVIKAILSHDGYEFMVVDNGLEVIELLEQETFDVILMDMQMPVMDGCQAAMEIRKREEVSGGRVRIIAITANATKGDRDICMAAGMDDYITKPIDAQILVAKLSSSKLSTDSSHEETEIIHKENPKLSVTSASIFNAESLKGRVLGQLVPSMKMVSMFLKELPNSLTDLDLALKANNMDEIAKLAHRIGGAAAMLGAEQMALVAEKLEAAASVGATKALPDLIVKMHLASIPLKEKLLQFVRQN